MTIIWVVIGGFIGAAVGGQSGGFFGMLAGAMIMYLLSSNAELRAQLQKLQQQFANLETVTHEIQRQVRELRRATPRPAEPEPLAEHDVPPVIQKPPPPLDDPDRFGTQSIAASPGRADAPQPQAATMRVPSAEKSAPSPDFFENLFDGAKRWLTTGNVPVKLGVLVSFFGVAFLLKYAVDNRVINIPIEARYLFVAAAAIVLLVLGWRLQHKQRVYALSLQGGGIGILYLTIFAAFSLHQVLPAGFAFFLMVLLTVATGTLAVLQNARALAVLGVVGGFLAPVLVSSGSGNHVALFSYYLVLNSAILGIAWHRAWRSLNIIGFIFTFGVGTLWGNESYTPEKFWSTEPFLIAFFVFYTAIAVLFAMKQPPKLRGFVDGTLVFGTPAITFALQSMLVSDTEYGLAISAIVVAVYYALLALWLHRGGNEQMRLLVQSFTALAVAFGTVAIPLALDDRWTSVSWAMEGAALVWIGVRQRGLLPKLMGTALSFASGYMFIDYGWTSDLGIPVLNGNVLGGLLISVAALFSARLLGTDRHPLPMQPFASIALTTWGALWWLAVGSTEILDRASSAHDVHFLQVFYAASFGALGYWALKKNWVAGRRGSLLHLVILLPVAAAYLVDKGHFLYGLGWLAWPLAMATHFMILRMGDGHDRAAQVALHYLGAMFFALLLGYEAYFIADDSNLSDLWSVSGTMLVFIAIAVGVRWLRPRFTWPLSVYAVSYSLLVVSLVLMQLLLLFVAAVDNSGDPRPLPYVPLLNPLDLFTIGGLLLAWQLIPNSARSSEELSPLRVGWASLAFVLSTIMVVRSVFHFSSLLWDWDVLFASDSVQAALSIYWAALGLGGMIWGARHARRSIWIAGVLLMVLVVCKLFLIDFGNTGTVARIISFIGVGVLLLVVGYFAPAPPRKTQVDEA